MCSLTAAPWSSSASMDNLSVPALWALDIDCYATTDASEHREAGHVVCGSGRSAQWSADCRSVSRDILNCLLMNECVCSKLRQSVLLSQFLKFTKWHAFKWVNHSFCFFLYRLTSLIPRLVSAAHRSATELGLSWLLRVNEKRLLAALSLLKKMTSSD